jgi:Tfp pilus assembly protein PilN
MKQNIDFLRSEPKPQAYLPGKLIALVCVCALALFILVTLGMVVLQVQHYVQLNTVRADNRRAEGAFKQLEKKHPLLADEIPLMQRIDNLKEELENKKEYYAIITKMALRYGFSNYLTSLATAVPKGLWLDEIYIDQEKKHVALSGYMLRPLDVSLFLDALQRVDAFKHMTFHLFRVKTLPDKSVIEFKITNTKVVMDN